MDATSQPRLWMVAQSRRGDYRATGSTSEIEKVLAAQWKKLDEKGLPIIPICIIIGGLLGLLLSPHPQSVPFASAVAALASAVKLATACPTCPGVALGGVDVAILGIMAYGGVLIAISCRGLSPRGAAVIGAVAAAGACFQLVLFMSYDVQCAPCSIIGACALFTAVSCARLCKGCTRVLPPWPRWAQVGMTACLVTVCGTAAILKPPPTGTVNGAGSAQSLILGAPISKLGLRPPFGPGAFLVVINGCHACDSALRYVATRPALGCRVLEIVMPGSTQSIAGTEPIPYRRGLIRGTPSIFVTDGQGTVILEKVGWSTGDQWQKGTVSEIEFRLATARGRYRKTNEYAQEEYR